ncbi:phenylalanine--tRNA ligase subunit alpha [Enterobacteriaceae endosymbiont of Donacia provostii]|uniref:phenylalanine--tRNA ligase subunit alpha n=1 Tax=Enterobacteriaceae endosymbiont of Donacia provostii TaxID=2675781 RepID=UPI001449314F|nr:phenylalanine--tRNA ligase subunit alpha [Enterobacteriaceae endosymbiont of Donacia provostii]QJC33597.1 phenylalanine--tRNA ligase subunit alpha [Enterobacteriaceae endosymbiont of Donacia provostii]
MVFNDIVIIVKKEISKVKNLKDLNILRVKYLGKKGYITKKFMLIKNFSKKERINKSFIYNKQKEEIKNIIIKRKKEIEIEQYNNNKFLNQSIDVSLPGKYIPPGTEHPITSIIYEIEKFFQNIGFKIITGPEIEDVYHNFDALNISKYHPTRTEQDTFWLDKNVLLRTQTSNVQIRIMKHNKPPIKILTSGKVYRHDYDSSHTPMFHQVEGLFIDKNVTFIDLKSILILFLNFFFGKKYKIRFRPSYFPFTEPSLEIDIFNNKKKWIEILGAGIVSSYVLKNIGINHNKYCGFAFGLGIERLAMLRYNIDDIRLFYENDIRFLKQFRFNKFL